MAHKKSKPASKPVNPKPKDGCYLETIDLDFEVNKEFELNRDKDNFDKISIYKWGKFDVPKDPLYFLTNSVGKKIIIKAKRIIINSCKPQTGPSTGLHKNIVYELNSKTKTFTNTGSNEIIATYYNITLFGGDGGKTKKYTDFIGLPTWGTSSPYNIEGNFSFPVCHRPKNFSVKYYPAIRYIIEINSLYDFKVKDEGKYSQGISIAVIYDGHRKSFSLSHSSPGGAFNLVSLIQRLGIVIKFFCCIDDFLMKTLGLKKGEEKLNEFLTDKFGPTRLATKYFDLSLTFPKINLKLDWHYYTIPNHTKIGKCYKIEIGLVPLLGGKITFHIFAMIMSGVAKCSTLCPPLAAFVIAAEKIISWLNKKKLLEIILDLTIAANVNLRLKGELKTYDSTALEPKLEFELPLTFKIGVKVTGTIFTCKVNGEASLTAEIKFTLEVKFKISLPENDSLKLSELAFLGRRSKFTVSIIIYGEVQFDDRNTIGGTLYKDSWEYGESGLTPIYPR